MFFQQFVAERVHKGDDVLKHQLLFVAAAAAPTTPQPRPPRLNSLVCVLFLFLCMPHFSRGLLQMKRSVQIKHSSTDCEKRKRVKESESSPFLCSNSGHSTIVHPTTPYNNSGTPVSMSPPPLFPPLHPTPTLDRLLHSLTFPSCLLPAAVVVVAQV